jgi:hypothetical protein
VVTHHNDTQRTGWNSSETILTPAVVSGGTFGLLQQVTLDAQVDAQPLLVTGLTLGGSTHDVVYVATEGNSVYAIDASAGTILLHTTLGTPVANTYTPGKCTFQGSAVGIASTPVIDTALQTLFVVAYVYTGSAPEYVLHALSLTTLADRVTPVAPVKKALLNNQVLPGNSPDDFFLTSMLFDADVLLERSSRFHAALRSA